MKTKITNWQFWMFLLMFNFGVNAQNLVTTTNCTTTTNCDGTATFNPSTVNTTNWSWQQDSVNVIQSGGTTIGNLCPGQYFLVYIDGSSNTVYSSFTINGPNTNPCLSSPITVSVTSTPTVIGACTGTLNAVVSATQNFTINWAPNFPNIGGMQSNVCAGTYTCTVSGNNGCTVTQTVVVGIDSTSANPCPNSTLAGSVSTTNASNPNSCNGTATLSVTGGLMPYNFTTNNGVMQPGGVPVFNNLCAGVCTFFVQDSLGCTITLTGNVGLDSTTTGPCAGSTLAGTVSTTNSSNPTMCNGSAALVVTGGSAPYNYMLSNMPNAGGNTSTTGNAVFVNLCPGIYTFMVQDNAGCMITLTGIISGDSTSVASNPCMMYGQVMTTNTTNPNTCDGSISVVVSGGSGNYVYQWNNGITVAADSNVCSGVYTVTVADNNGCVITATGYVGTVMDSTMAGNMPLNGYVIPSSVSADGVCDGTAAAIVYGGLAPYSYLYSDGNTNSTTANLCQGLQSVIVTDANGASLNLSFIISSPATTINTPNYVDSTIQDSTYVPAINNCVVDYTSVDSAFIQSFNILPNDSLSVIWNVVFGDSSVTVTVTYGLGIGTTAAPNGVYMVVLQLYCPNKNLSSYLTATDQIYYNAASAGIHNVVKNQFSVYPNPFNDHVVIQLENDQPSEISVTDITGKEVFRNNYNSETINIDLSALASGQYILNVKNGTGVMNRKIIK